MKWENCGSILNTCHLYVTADFATTMKRRTTSVWSVRRSKESTKMWSRNRSLGHCWCLSLPTDRQCFPFSWLSKGLSSSTAKRKGNITSQVGSLLEQSNLLVLWKVISEAVADSWGASLKYRNGQPAVKQGALGRLIAIASKSGKQAKDWKAFHFSVAFHNLK